MKPLSLQISKYRGYTLLSDNTYVYYPQNINVSSDELIKIFSSSNVLNNIIDEINKKFINSKNSMFFRKDDLGITLFQIKNKGKYSCKTFLFKNDKIKAIQKAIILYYNKLYPFGFDIVNNKIVPKPIPQNFKFEYNNKIYNLIKEK